MTQRGNWGLRVAVALCSVMVFGGFWQAAAHTPVAGATQSGEGPGGTNYAPPATGGQGLIPPASFPHSPDASTHVS